MGMTTWWLVAPVLCGFWLVLVGAIVWMSVALAKALRARRAAETPSRATAGETPLATLQRRLALGEVDVETYERSVAALERTTPAPAAETTGDAR
ncbi:hypothetical protein [Xylanimonas protaetiae]|uniref:hypothetical protein n=1 Tax=Xylanimonas protaetiae TaxID=2509457 RepID=UPI001A91AF28|nr:hypothetical protein [Xylanimonas protaetiae]